MTRRLLLSVLVLSIVTGCSEATTVDKSKGVEWSQVGDMAFVAEITLPSGVRCVLYDDYRSGGIDCDWSAR